MSEQTNIALVRGAYESFSRGDIQDILNRMSDDVEFNINGPRALPMVGRYRGKNEVVKFFQIIADVEEAEIFEQQKFIAQGDDVIVLGHYRWRIKATGRIAEADYAHAFTVRDGKVTRYQEYTDTAVFAEAFGVAAAVST